jgi:tetratricopeptide (TPR) repeat protein
MDLRRWRIPIGLGVLLGGAAIVYVFPWSRAGLPSPDTSAYAQATTHFYRGLAAFEVGLTDDARREWTAASALAAGEPAIWANLALAHLRLADIDAAAPPLERAVSLAGSDPHVAFLVGRFEILRGRRDEGMAALRRAVSLDPRRLTVRTALIQEIENSGTPDADIEAQRLIDEQAQLAPDNLAVILDRARIAAKRGDLAVLREAVARLGQLSTGWPPEVLERYRDVEQAAGAGSSAEAVRAIAFLRNVLTIVPAFVDARRRVTSPSELVAEPFTRYLRLSNLDAAPAPEDMALAFTRSPIGGTTTDTVLVVTALSPDGEAPPIVVAADASGVRRADAPGFSVPASFPVSGFLPLDWNHDFKVDLVAYGSSGIRLLTQMSDGDFADATVQAAGAEERLTSAVTGAWAADIEMDGDLDVVTGAERGVPAILRNNGDGTWRRTQPFAGLDGLRDFAWADLDHDGDPDAAAIDGAGTLRVFANLQAGQFVPFPDVPDASRASAITAGDLDADGRLDLVVFGEAGQVRRLWFESDRWSVANLVSTPAHDGGRGARLFLADLDNNGALDLVVARREGAAVWLGAADRTMHALPTGQLDGEVQSIIDLNADGQLDLLAVDNGRVVGHLGRSALGYRHQIVRPRAQQAAGDQRINTFGIGGEIETRAGRLVQKQVIAGPVIHFGLGTRTAIDVTRIVWPNGVAQAEFDPDPTQPLVATQRLKGSCPWVFANNGKGLQFVTDFLWRSPLGLRINAQDTAGITQTEDWVRIGGDQLVAENGAYDVRISAELWETHFVDHVSLLAVDHPSDVSVFVDERFARDPPSLAVRAFRDLRRVTRAWDQQGRDVTEIIAARDGRALDSFSKGPYQGVAEEHFLELDLGEPIARNTRSWLAASGWIYPTDSSINVGIGQGRTTIPRGLSLEAQDGSGRWVVVAPDLGFPAGKNKTVLLDLSEVWRAGVAGARRVRLRTNLEIYWDTVMIATEARDVTLQSSRLAATRADLTYRGFSVTTRARRDVPETPTYGRIANTAPRWRDLVGFYTRFGDVRELVAGVDDRYVIMNAGDELRLSFDAPAAPPTGWARDFVLIGDGWVKDGDFNTAFAKTVLPLPRHGTSDYGTSRSVPQLHNDPVYLDHREDWLTYHTRWVEPSAYLAGLHFDRSDAP